MVGLVMILEAPLVFGACIPWMLPLAAIDTGLNGCIFQTALAEYNMGLAHQSSLSTSWLWLAISLGWCLMSWIFIECSFAGSFLVLFGMPLCIVSSKCMPSSLLAAVWKFSACRES